MRYISIDLAIRQTGIVVYDDITKLYHTFTIKRIDKFNVANIEFVKEWIREFERVSINTYTIADSEDILLIEYTPFTKFSTKLLCFASAIIHTLSARYKVIPMNSTKWEKLADTLFPYKKKDFTTTKKWITANVQHLKPKNLDLSNQDLRDAYLMLLTYLEKPNRF